MVEQEDNAFEDFTEDQVREIKLAIEKSREDIRNGRVMDHDEVMAYLRKKYLFFKGK